MKFIKALNLSLGDIDKPVITKYQLGILVHNLYREKTYKGTSIGVKKETAERKDFNRYVDQLLDDGVLAHHKNLPNTVYTLLGRVRWEAEDVACTVDPFAYISHLSAMSYHGLTDRIPAKLFLSTPQANAWKIFAAQRMQRDLQNDYEMYCENGLPQLQRTEMKKIGRIEIQRFSSKHTGAFKNVQGRAIRVATIGRTFMDMLRNPELCGGINHILKVYDEFAERYLRLITDEIENHGKPIDKVRAGYIIEERLKIKNQVVENWAGFAQRGGSRKLDASAEYEPVWSDKWCLSLNVYE